MQKRRLLQESAVFLCQSHRDVWLFKYLLDQYLLIIYFMPSVWLLFVFLKS